MSDDRPDDPQPPDTSEAGGMPDLDGLLGGLGGQGDGGLGDLFAQAQQAMAASQAAAEREVEGTAGGGVVRVRATGAGEVLEVTLAPEVVDPTDVETLQDLIVAALRDVNTRITELQTHAMGDLDPGAMLGGLFGDVGDPERDGPERDDPERDEMDE